MNWAAVAAIAAICGSCLTLASSVFFAGRLTQQLRDTREDVEDLREGHKDHTEKLNEHQVEIAKLNAWREGYNAATRASHETHA